MLKAIIFDMDGLMIDSETLTYSYYCEVLEEMGYPFDFSIYKNFLGKPRVKVMQLLKEYYGEDFPLQKAWDEIHERVIEAIKKQAPIKKGLIELLKYLKENNYKTIVATSNDRWRVEIVLNSANITSYFDDIICGNEVKKGKPDPEIFLTACKKLNVNPSEALVLEDSESGILASHRANIDVICIPDMIVPAKEYLEKTTAVYDSLEEVINYIKDYSCE